MSCLQKIPTSFIHFPSSKHIQDQSGELQHDSKEQPAHQKNPEVIILGEKDKSYDECNMCSSVAESASVQRCIVCGSSEEGGARGAGLLSHLSQQFTSLSVSLCFHLGVVFCWG